MTTLSELAQHIQALESIGDPRYQVSGVSSLQDASSGDISFLLSPKFFNQALESKAGVLVTSEKLPSSHHQLIVPDPRKAMVQVLDLLFPHFNGFTSNTSSERTTTIHPSAQIGSDVVIGDFSHIGEETTIGNGTQIATTVTIGARCRIGQNCVIYPQVVIYDGIHIGNNVRIHSGVVIGADGFGYTPGPQGIRKIPQVGSVVIEDNVEIGANTCIDRGTLSATKIGNGTKIDNLVHIAHNSIVGKHCILTGQVGLVGSAILEDQVTIGGQAGINAIRVGKGSTIAAKAGVTKDCPPHSVLSGFPAWPIANELKKEALLRKMVKAKSKGSL